MQRYRYVRVSSLLFYSALICIALYALTEDVGISISGFPDYRRNILFLAMLFLIPRALPHLKKLISIKYLLIICIGIAFFIFLMHSANISSIGYYSKYVTTELILFFIAVFLLIIDTVETKRINEVIKVFFWIILLLVIINDSLIFMGIKFTDGVFETYLIGTKFSVAYLHIYLLAFYLLRKKAEFRFYKRHIVLLVLFVVAVIGLSLRVDCNTGMLGCMLFVVIIILFNTFPNKFLRIFTNPMVLLCCFVGSALIAFGFETLMNSPVVEHIVVDILHRQTNLTGRTEIFALFIIRMTGHWMWGYGYGSAYTTSMELFGYADAQNAILQWILQVGILSTICMIVIWAFSFKGLSKQKNIIEIMPLIALVYVFIILGTVEITFNMSFILWIGLIYMWVLQQKKENKR